MARCPGLKAALPWVASALHELQVLDEVSGLHLVPPPIGDTGPQFCMLTLHQLWSQGQQVILSYKDEASMSQHAELWPGIPYWWGNQVKP